MFAAHHALPITLVIDRNTYQVQGSTESICALEPFGEKWNAFGWRVEHVDGHDVDALQEAFRIDYNPLVLIAHTTKGKGVSFMEGAHDWHHGSIKGEMLDRARAELGT